RESSVHLVHEIQSLPYVWPCPADAANARTNRAGSCASKHALLAEELEAVGIAGSPLLVTGPLVPAMLSDEPDFAAGRHLIEVHECLAVLTPWAGPLRVDVTWDRRLIAHGLPGTLDWDGHSDMAVAVGETGAGWSVRREHLREAKEALRARLYGPGEREIRDEILALLAERFARWRTEAG
ncbi:MAG: hypothetical protein ACREU7_01165, partial [Burkholderiales bacterium]